MRPPRPHHLGRNLSGYVLRTAVVRVRLKVKQQLIVWVGMPDLQEQGQVHAAEPAREPRRLDNVEGELLYVRAFGGAPRNGPALKHRLEHGKLRRAARSREHHLRNRGVVRLHHDLDRARSFGKRADVKPGHADVRVGVQDRPHVFGLGAVLEDHFPGRGQVIDTDATRVVWESSLRGGVKLAKVSVADARGPDNGALGISIRPFARETGPRVHVERIRMLHEPRRVGLAGVPQ